MCNKAIHANCNVVAGGVVSKLPHFMSGLAKTLSHNITASKEQIANTVKALSTELSAMGKKQPVSEAAIRSESTAELSMPHETHAAISQKQDQRVNTSQSLQDNRSLASEVQAVKKELKTAVKQRSNSIPDQSKLRLQARGRSNSF